MWVYNLDTLRFLAVNHAAVAKYGYSREEFLTMTIAAIRPEEDRPALYANVAAVTEGRDEAGVWRHCLKSGQTVYVEITSHTVDHDGSRAKLVAARDVTERVENTRALERAKRMLEIAGTSAKFGAWRYEVTADGPEWSTETARIHDEPDGFSPKISDAIAYYAPEHRGRIASLIQACIDRGQPFDETFKIITAKGAGSGCVRPARRTVTRLAISKPFKVRFRISQNWCLCASGPRKPKGCWKLLGGQSSWAVGA